MEKRLPQDALPVNSCALATPARGQGRASDEASHRRSVSGPHCKDRFATHRHDRVAEEH